MKNLIRIFAIVIIFTTIASCEDEERPDVDLAVTDIEFEMQDIDPQNSDFDGTAVITAVIQNVGTDDFTSGENQQGIYIYQEDGYFIGVVEVHYESFGNLAAGETIRISYTRDWNISSTAEGEFPPNYRASLSFDPDIGIDGNPYNDDADPSNNERTEAGSQLNEF